MSNLHVQYLLVGGGIAASAAAEAIRLRDSAGSAVLVGQEANRPYNRPPLSKQFLRDEVSRESLFTRDRDWFTQHRINLQTGHRVAAIDVNHRTVVLDSGKEIGFEKLLLAIGASPNTLEIPGAALPNMFYVRTLADIDRLRSSIDQAKRFGRLQPAKDALPRNTTTGRGRATVIGGGLLGVEMAASLTQLGVAVDLVVATAGPWHDYAGEVAGRFIARLLEHHGVTVHLSTTALRLEGDGRVQRVILSGGQSIETDFAIGAIGVSVNRQLLRDTPIRAEKAILTDAHGQTNVPGIFAAGDCAAVFDPAVGKHRIGQHHSHAQLTGHIAGDNMSGASTSFDAVPQFESEVFGTSFCVFGESKLVERRLLRGTPNVDSPKFLEIGLSSAGQVRQIITVGGDHDFEKLESMVRQRTHINGNEEHLKDPDSSLGDL